MATWKAVRLTSGRMAIVGSDSTDRALFTSNGWRGTWSTFVYGGERVYCWSVPAEQAGMAAESVRRHNEYEQREAEARMAQRQAVLERRQAVAAAERLVSRPRINAAGLLRCEHCDDGACCGRCTCC